MTVTFFGHRDTPESVKIPLRSLLLDLIKNHNATHFLVGNHGSFDRMVWSTLQELKRAMPDIEATVVLAYTPLQKNPYADYGENTVVPYGIENVPKKFAIDKRNLWMIEQADAVVCYVKYQAGKAAYYCKKAERKGKKIWNVSI